MIGSIQAEHQVWVDREYPDQPPEVPAYGMIEEAGEMLHALLKLKQLDLWGKDDRYTREKLQDEVRDAVGDCLIYVCSYLNAKLRLKQHVGVTFAELLDFCNSYNRVLMGYKMPLEAAADAVHVSSRNVVSPSKRDLAVYVEAVLAVAQLCHFSWQDALLSTWNVVKRRIRDGAKGKDSPGQKGSGFVLGCDFSEGNAGFEAREVP